MPKPSKTTEEGRNDAEVRDLRIIVQGAEFGKLNSSKLDKLADRVSKNRLHGEDLLEARCLLSLCYDYLAEFQKAKEVVEPKDPQIAKSEDPLSCPEGEILAHALYATSLYRLNHYDDADRLFQKCEAAAHSLDVSESSLELLAHVAYFRGQIARQRGNFEIALTYLTQAVTYATDLYNHGAKRQKGARLESLLNRTSYLMGKTMIQGLGWLFFSRGQLKNARPTVMAGTILAQRTGDEVLRGFAQLILGAIERAEGGSDPASITKAIALLKEAYSIFQKTNRRYVAIAEFYLATSYWYQGELDEAETYVKACKEHRHGDAQWQAKVDILRSRILCSRAKQTGKSHFIPQARAAALEAIGIAGQGGFSVGVAEGEIALAEAELAGGSRTDARKSFERALKISQEFENPKSAGACHLHLARIYAQEHKPVEAHEHLQEWDSLARFIENGTLQSWASDLRKELGSEDQDFVISRNTEDLDEVNNVVRLKKWLMTVSVKRYGNKTQAAKAMGRSRQALHNRGKE